MNTLGRLTAKLPLQTFDTPPPLHPKQRIALIALIGTYTAYSGREIRAEFLRIEDFTRFDLIPITGGAARNMGLALFPKCQNGKFHMIGRHDGQNMFLLESEDITHWDEGVPLLTPRFPWELIEIGNCGPPIEIDEGYVPNVVYSCGGMPVGEDIFLPHGVADSSVAFAFVAITDLLGAM